MNEKETLLLPSTGESPGLPGEPNGDKGEHYLPPRKTVHGTQAAKRLHWFYRTLLWLFVTLVIGLLAWGWKLVRA